MRRFSWADLTVQQRCAANVYAFITSTAVKTDLAIKFERMIRFQPFFRLGAPPTVSRALGGQLGLCRGHYSKVRISCGDIFCDYKIQKIRTHKKIQICGDNIYIFFGATLHAHGGETMDAAS